LFIIIFLLMFRLFITLFFVGYTCVYAQNTQDEALGKAILSSDSVKNPNAAESILLDVLPKAAKASDKVRGEYYYHLGITLGMLYKVDSSKLFLEKSIRFAKAASDTLTQIGSLNGLGNVARITSENDLASDYFQRALALAESENTKPYLQWRSKLLGNIAGIFFDMGKLQDAKAYTNRAFVNAQKIADSISMATNLIQLGYCLNALNQTDSAVLVNEQATSILETTGDSSKLIYQYYSMGDIYLNKGELTAAKYSFEKSIKLAKRFGEAETEAGSMNALARIYMETNDPEKASKLLAEAVDLASTHGLLTLLKRSYHLLHELAVKQGHMSQAIAYLKKFHQIKDSVQRKENMESIEEFRVKYEAAEREKQALEARAELEQNQRFQMFLVILLVIVLIFSVTAILLITQRAKLKRSLLSQEIDTLRAQIQTLIPQVSKVEIDAEKLNSALYHPLSERETQILKHAISNKSNNEIAEELFLSINTVKTHLRNLYSKLGVSNRKEALEVIMRS